MLNKKEIQNEIKLGADDPSIGLGVTPNPLEISDKQIGPGSLDLRLGRWFLVIQQSKRSVIDLSQKITSSVGQLDGKHYYIPFHEKFVLHPGRFVLASTLEWLRVPGYLGAYITGKSSLGRRGLVIETAAGIQPGFKGCLTLELYNCGEIPIAITPGMRIAQVFFHRLTDSVKINDSQFNGHRKPLFGSHKLDIKSGTKAPGLFR